MDSTFEGVVRYCGNASTKYGRPFTTVLLFITVTFAAQQPPIATNEGLSLKGANVYPAKVGIYRHWRFVPLLHGNRQRITANCFTWRTRGVLATIFSAPWLGASESRAIRATLRFVQKLGYPGFHLVEGFGVSLRFVLDAGVSIAG